MIFVQNVEILKRILSLFLSYIAISVRPICVTVSAYMHFYVILIISKDFLIASSYKGAKSLMAIGIMTNSEKNDIRKISPFLL